MNFNDRRHADWPNRFSRFWKSLVLFVISLSYFGIASPVEAQVSPAFYEYPRSYLDWYTIETEHFLIHFHADASGQSDSRTAQVVARIAEEIYDPITSLYEHEPDTKVSFILKDFEDYSNGAAYFFDNKIEIWAPSLNTPLRGEHNWLRNVITHEFTHIVQVQKTMKNDRRWPVYYLQWLNYEDIKRPDLLYGYPNGIVSYPIPALNNPAWLAEGTAQFQRVGLNYDNWDTHRDMLLRTQVLDGTEFSLAEMGSFQSKTSLQRESVYNHGFGFVHYLANTYGEGILRTISSDLSQWSTWNVERAISEAVGQDADSVYAAWIQELRQDYTERTLAIREHEKAGRIIEPNGFINHFPRYSPDGNRLAYISNRDEDFSLTSLYVQDLQTDIIKVFPLEGYAQQAFSMTCALDGQLLAGVSGSFDWRPDGKAIIYSRIKDTPFGARYLDLYELDLETEKSKQLTRNRRAAAPAYAPDGQSIAYVTQKDGTTNLYRLQPESGEISPVTSFADGTQVFQPVWHPSGEWIYFSRSYFSGRDLYRVRPDGTDLEPVLNTPGDERNPVFDAEGNYLYFSSDQSGIFNIYRMPFRTETSTSSGETLERITNVVGGAFMPDVHRDGRLVYAHYKADGYKIAEMDQVASVEEVEGQFAYSPPPITRKLGSPAQDVDWNDLNTFDDRDLRRRDTFVSRPGEPAEGADEEVHPYGSGVFTSFSFYPVVRLDWYADAQRNRLDAQRAQSFQGGTLLRNTKVGLYMSSREVLEGLTIFGGVLIAPVSVESKSVGDFFAPARLISLERDAFLQFEYKKGLPFISKRWSPQLSVELYNLKRNVNNGLEIEEFPCTACYPDTTFTDVVYSLWEADFYARSKINSYTLFEFGYRYSPYTVRTESFFSEENRQTIGASSTRYFIGHGPSLKVYIEQFHPHKHSEVVPQGIRAEVGYDYQRGRLLDNFAVEDGALVPKYINADNHRLFADLRLGLRFKGKLGGGAHGLGLRLKGSTILGEEVDDFYNDYVGGLIGARGYPFYALGGNETIWTQVSYHFPILPSLKGHMLFLDLDKVYGRLYADAAMAWDGPWPGTDGVRKDVGAELRLGLGSFYLFPTAFFVSATYGLDQFDFELDEGFLAPDGSNVIQYGKEWRWHFGLLFNFDL